MSEIQAKLGRLRALLELQGLDAALLTRNANFAWLTEGASGYVNTATDQAASSILITATAQYILANSIEAPRLQAEERVTDLGFELRVAPWYEPNPALDELTRGLRLGTDTPRPGATDISEGVKGLRVDLLPAERQRFRDLSFACAQAMDAAIRQVRPGMTEFQIAGLLASETYARGAVPIVNLIGTDERIYRFRHPLPTTRPLERYAMLVLCGRRYGLVCSLTRLVHFGRLPEELRGKQDACAAVDATFVAGTRPGRSLAEVLRLAQAAYAGTGYPDEWQRHHQGGLAGYEPRERLGTPGATDKLVRSGQAYAWNPSITGVKSEDTILVLSDRTEILTEIRGWPTVRVDIAGQSFLRPAILEIV